MNETQLRAQLTRLTALADVYLDAITAIVTGGQESYRIDTGQNIVQVDKLNLATIQNQYEKLLDLCETLQARLSDDAGGTVFQGAPLI